MLDRNFRRSVFDYTKSLLTAPPAGTFGSAFNVYTNLKSQYRNIDFEPVRPFVFMMDSNIEPTVSRVPLVIVEVTGFGKTPYELGNRNGHLASVDLNVFGDTRGARDDLTTLFRDYFGLTFTVYDYTTSGSPAIDTAELLDEPIATNVSLGEDVAEDSTLMNFCVISFECILKT